MSVFANMFKSLVIYYLNYVVIFVALIADIKKDILIKDDRYFLFIKVGAANVIIPSNIKTFYRKIKCDLLNFGGVQNGYHQDFHYLIVSIKFFSLSANAYIKFYAR